MTRLFFRAEFYFRRLKYRFGDEILSVWYALSLVTFCGYLLCLHSGLSIVWILVGSVSLLSRRPYDAMLLLRSVLTSWFDLSPERFNEGTGENDLFLEE